MSRSEVFSPLDVTTLTVKLTWANLEIASGNGKELQVMISGDDNAVESIHVSCTGGKLTIDQANPVSTGIIAPHWMEVLLRVPADWKGAIDLSTVQGRLNARGLTGSDINLDTVTGDLRAEALQGITVTLNTVSGRLTAEDIRCDQLTLRTVTGDTATSGLNMLKGSVHGVNTDWHLGFSAAFDSLDAATVTGNVFVDAPILDAFVRYRTVSGRLRTWGVSLQDSGTPITMTSVSGNLEITAIPPENTNEP